MGVTAHDRGLVPPVEQLSILSWLRKNLFRTWYDSVLTVLALGFTYWMLKAVITWALRTARWEVVAVNLRLFMTGQYPTAELWRMWLILYLLGALAGLTIGVLPRRTSWLTLVLLASPALLALAPLSPTNRLHLVGIAALSVLAWVAGQRGRQRLARLVVSGWVIYLLGIFLIVRGTNLLPGVLPVVPSHLWGGLLLTFLLTVTGIFASFPLGVMLALGRRSNFVIMKMFSIAYIELVRGVPLITILFMAQLMVPLFLPGDITIDRVLRAMVGTILFSAAYLAENVRGGLQIIPSGQYEAAYALGLSGFQTTFRIVLPQALRAVIPILVGQFIALFKDTSLVAIVGLLELLGIARTVLAQPNFIGRQVEVYAFISLIYWVLSYLMSYLSQKLEVRLGVGVR